MSSVPSLCQVTSALSMGAPSGGPSSFPWAVKLTCHIPTIGSAESATVNSEPLLNPNPLHDCRWRSAPYLFESPHAALAFTASRHTEAKANIKTLNLFCMWNLLGPIGRCQKVYRGRSSCRHARRVNSL